MTLQKKPSQEPSDDFFHLFQQVDRPKIGIALGSFLLIHAGTIRFLRQVRSECDCLVAAVMAEPSSGATGAIKQLLRPDERVTIMRALQEVDAAHLLDTAAGPERWPEAIRRATWYYSAEENDVDASLLEKIRSAGPQVVAIGKTGDCTTRAVVERMARGKRAENGA